VPFAGGAPTMTALMGGQIDYMCGDIIVGASPHAAGNIKVYALAAPKPNPALPNVPSTVEAGLPAFQASAWNGLFAPKGTPKPILDRLTDALDKALDDETSRKRMAALGSDIPEKAERGQAAFHALVKKEMARWSPIIKATGITAN
jgi:tripartite-type tricarboxylate transporter receptor subunit TctC